MQSEVRVYALPDRVMRSMIPRGAEHRPIFSVRAMCRCLRLHPSGFYAWVKNPLSHRAQEDERQTQLLKEAWQESGNIYGYPLAVRALQAMSREAQAARRPLRSG